MRHKPCLAQWPAARGRRASPLRDPIPAIARASGGVRGGALVRARRPWRGRRRAARCRHACGAAGPPHRAAAAVCRRGSHTPDGCGATAFGGLSVSPLTPVVPCPHVWRRPVTARLVARRRPQLCACACVLAPPGPPPRCIAVALVFVCSAGRAGGGGRRSAGRGDFGTGFGASGVWERCPCARAGSCQAAGGLDRGAHAICAAPPHLVCVCARPLEVQSAASRQRRDENTACLPAGSLAACSPWQARLPERVC